MKAKVIFTYQWCNGEVIVNEIFRSVAVGGGRWVLCEKPQLWARPHLLPQHCTTSDKKLKIFLLRWSLILKIYLFRQSQWERRQSQFQSLCQWKLSLCFFHLQLAGCAFPPPPALPPDWTLPHSNYYCWPRWKKVQRVTSWRLWPQEIHQVDRKLQILCHSALSQQKTWKLTQMFLLVILYMCDFISITSEWGLL